MDKSTKKAIILSVISAVLAPIVYNFLLLSWKSKYSYATGSDWMGFFGNYIGGILSAAVAYLVTSMQIRAQNRIEKDKRMIDQLPAMVGIKIELEKLSKWVSNAKIIASAGLPPELQQQGIDYRHLNYLGPTFGEFNQTNWNEVSKISDVTLQVELIKLKEFYEEFLHIARFDLQTLNFSEQDFNDPTKISQTLQKVSMQQVMSLNKQFMWDEMEKREYLANETQVLLDRIGETISEIEKLI